MLNHLISLSPFDSLSNDWLMGTLLTSGKLQPDVWMFTHWYAAVFCINPLNNLHLFSW